MSIRNKLILILLLFSTIPVICLGLIEITKNRETLKKQIGNSSLELARSSMRRINEYLHSKYVGIQGWTRNKSLNDITTGDKNGNISRFLMNLTEIHDEYYYVNCLNDKGQIVASSNADLIGNTPDLIGSDLTTDTGLRDALNGNPTIQDVAFDKIAGGYAVVMSFPVRDIPEQSEVIGVITVALKWDKVNEIITDELKAVKKDGTEFPIEHSVSAVKIKGKWNAIGIIRDITERKQAEEQIKASLREKEVLILEIYHRTRNNMQIICSLLKLQSKYISPKSLP